DRALRAVVVNSGQHAGAVRDAFAEFGIRHDVELGSVPSLPNLLAAFEHLRIELAAVVARYRPRCVVVQGDTLTTYTAAWAGRAAGCSVAHVEAGLRTASPAEPFPEEWFRRRIARLADVHFAPTDAAVSHLRSEGIPATTIRRRLGTHPAFELVAPLPYRDFIALAKDAALIISDSGGIQEEAPHLGTPLLVPRGNTERPEAIATGFVRLVAVDEHAIIAAAQ